MKLKLLNRNYSKITFFALVTACLFPSIIHAFDESSPYGIGGTGNNNQGRWDLITDAGFAWNRTDFEWFAIESKKGEFHWQREDDIVRNANEKGVNLFISLDYMPQWASASMDADPQVYKHGPLIEEQEFLDAWHDFFYNAMVRYRGPEVKNKEGVGGEYGQVKYWGIWNEPNLGQFWNGTQEQFADQIAYYSGRAFAKFKKDFPTAEVYLCGPELSTTTSQTEEKIISWAKDIRKAVEKGGKSVDSKSNISIDVITMHQYDGKDVPELRIEAMDRWHKLMTRSTIFGGAGYSKKLPYWITECGWPTADKKAVTEEVQADYLIQMYNAAKERKWLDKLFWFSLFDGNDPHKYGILKNEGDNEDDIKLAYTAYKELIASSTN